MASGEGNRQGSVEAVEVGAGRRGRDGCRRERHPNRTGAEIGGRSKQGGMRKGRRNNPKTETANKICWVGKSNVGDSLERMLVKFEQRIVFV